MDPDVTSGITREVFRTDLLALFGEVRIDTLGVECLCGRTLAPCSPPGTLHALPRPSMQPWAEGGHA
jgi:hypothetical protein